MTFETLIALSHLRSRKQDVGVSLIAALSVVGVTAGVAVLIIVLSVMQGFEVDLRDKILGNNAHLLVLSYDGGIPEPIRVVEQVERQRGVIAAAPFVYSEVMLRSKFATSGAVLKGVDLERAPRVTDLVSELSIGPEGALPTAEAKAAVLANLRKPPMAMAQDVTDTEVLAGILLGEGLAEQLKVLPGDRVHVINPVGGGVGPMGVPIPQARTFRVAGIFHTGMYEYDTKWSYVANEDALDFLQLGTAVTGLEVRVEERLLYDVIELGGEVDAALGYPYYSRNWLTLNEALFAAMKLEKWVMGLILTLIVLIAALGIVTNLVVLVVTRGREIAILKAMGASNDSIQRVFIIQGVLIGLVGTLAGGALGLLFCAALDRYKFPLDTNVYYLDSLPVVVQPQSVAIVMVGAMILCFLATLYPAGRAAALDPVEGLRYE